MYEFTKWDSFAKGFVIVTGVAFARCWKKEAEEEVVLSPPVEDGSRGASRLLRIGKILVDLVPEGDMGLTGELGPLPGDVPEKTSWLRLGCRERPLLFSRGVETDGVRENVEFDRFNC